MTTLVEHTAEAQSGRPGGIRLACHWAWQQPTAVTPKFCRSASFLRKGTHMTRRCFIPCFALFAVCCFQFAQAAEPNVGSAGLDTAKIEQLTGLKGTFDAKEGVFKVSYPRSDIQATAAGAETTPPVGPNCWGAVSKVGAHLIGMGGTRLAE